MVLPQHSLVEHIEKYLGTIRHGWSQSPDGTKLPCQIIECSGGTVDARVFCTLGLSRYSLESRVSGKSIHQELMIIAPKVSTPKNIPAVLEQLARAALGHKAAFLCGEVIERNNPVFEGFSMRGFCAAVPNILPEEFAVFADHQNTQIVFTWMAPLTDSEIQFVRKNGWDQTLNLFRSKHVDLTDFARRSVV